jgi:hypothetical protein
MRKIALAIAALVALSSPSLHAHAAVAQRNVSPTATFDAGILHVERFGKPMRARSFSCPVFFADPGNGTRRSTRSHRGMTFWRSPSPDSGDNR